MSTMSSRHAAFFAAVSVASAAFSAVAQTNTWPSKIGTDLGAKFKEGHT